MIHISKYNLTNVAQLQACLLEPDYVRGKPHYKKMHTNQIFKGQNKKRFEYKSQDSDSAE